MSYKNGKKWAYKNTRLYEKISIVQVFLRWDCLVYDIKWTLSAFKHEDLSMRSPVYIGSSTKKMSWFSITSLTKKISRFFFYLILRAAKHDWWWIESTWWMVKHASQQAIKPWLMTSNERFMTSIARFITFKDSWHQNINSWYQKLDSWCNNKIHGIKSKIHDTRIRFIVSKKRFMILKESFMISK